MNVSLTPELEKFIQNEVSSGLYQTASEVVRAALRRLKEDQRRATLPRDRKELEARLLASIEQLDRGEGQKAASVFHRLGKRMKKVRVHG